MTCPECHAPPLRTCPACGLRFVPRYDPPEDHCGPGCWPSKEVVNRRKRHVCENCGKEFLARQNRRRYCSKACSLEGRYPVRKECRHCGKAFLTTKTKNYCSYTCRRAGRLKNMRAALKRRREGSR